MIFKKTGKTVQDLEVINPCLLKKHVYAKGVDVSIFMSFTVNDMTNGVNHDVLEVFLINIIRHSSIFCHFFGEDKPFGLKLLKQMIAFV